MNNTGCARSYPVLISPHYESLPNWFQFPVHSILVCSDLISDFNLFIYNTFYIFNSSNNCNIFINIVNSIKKKHILSCCPWQILLYLKGWLSSIWTTVYTWLPCNDGTNHLNRLNYCNIIIIYNNSLICFAQLIAFKMSNTILILI